MPVGIGGQDDAGLGQGVVGEEDLDQQRGPANERHVQGGDRVGHRVRAEPPEGSDDGQDRGEHDRQDRYEDRDPDPAEDVRAALDDELGIHAAGVPEEQAQPADQDDPDDGEDQSASPSIGPTR